MTHKIIHGDCLEVLRKGTADSIDCIVTDPPYGYSFMGKDWDKAVPSVEIWQECLRVLKPGAFAFVMSAPRQDVLSQMIVRLTEAGFDTDFTSIYWTYASGFPKAMNMGKSADAKVRTGKSGPTGINRSELSKEGGEVVSALQPNNGILGEKKEVVKREGAELVSDEAKALDGSYAGFQPKPAVEVILVAMKPLSEKTYVDQALANGHGVTWLDSCRIPCASPEDMASATPGGKVTGKSGALAGGSQNENDRSEFERPDVSKGRFPANLLVQDDVLNDGKERKAGVAVRRNSGGKNIHSETEKPQMEDMGYGDAGSYSRFFSLDSWSNLHLKDLPESVQRTFPFLLVAKASKREKNEGLEGFEEKELWSGHANQINGSGQPAKPILSANTHATVKPLTLMSYLITLGSRPGDTILDPFVGSGTTVCAAKALGRIGIGIEREEEYVKIAEARVTNI